MKHKITVQAPPIEYQPVTVEMTFDTYSELLDFYTVFARTSGSYGMDLFEKLKHDHIKAGDR